MQTRTRTRTTWPRLEPPRRVSCSIQWNKKQSSSWRIGTMCFPSASPSAQLHSSALRWTASRCVSLTFRPMTLTHFTLSQFGDYVFFNATNNGISPLAGFTQHLGNTSVQIKYAEGCKLWSNDPSGIPAAVEAAKSADAAIVLVGTWSLDQTLLWTPGTNATTGEHVDVSDLGLVGAQLQLVQAVKDAAQGKPTIVVLVSGKPVAEPWIQARELPFRSSSILSPCAYCVLSLLLFDPLAWMDTCTDDRCRCCRTAVLSWRTRWSRTR